jgi:hypothetical protein
VAFYYTSLLSAVPLGIAYGLLALTFFGVIHVTRKTRNRGIVLVALGLIFLLLPIAEELWIAWHFARACDEAGTLIKRQVKVAGFYDDTRSTHAGPPTAQAVESFEKSGFRFLEMKGREKFVRIEKIDGQWKPSVLDHPSARYHFKHTDPMNGTPWGHKIGRSGSVVMDTQTGEEIARYTSFGRKPPWFYISLGNAPFACDAPGDWPNSRKSALVHREVLIPESLK